MARPETEHAPLPLACTPRTTPASGVPVLARSKAQELAQAALLASTLVNIERYNNGERGGVENELRRAVPVLVKLGLFCLFTPDEWATGANPGRQLVGLAAKIYLGSERDGGGPAR